MIGFVVAGVVIAAILLLLTVVLSACVVSGNVSEAERRQEIEARPGFAQVGETGQNEPENVFPIDNNRLSLGHDRIEDDNAD